MFFCLFVFYNKLYRRKRYPSVMKKLEKPILFLRKFKIYLKFFHLFFLKKTRKAF